MQVQKQNMDVRPVQDVRSVHAPLKPVQQDQASTIQKLIHSAANDKGLFDYLTERYGSAFAQWLVDDLERFESKK